MVTKSYLRLDSTCAPAFMNTVALATLSTMMSSTSPTLSISDSMCNTHSVNQTHSPPVKPVRFADGTVDASRGRLFCIREDHSEKGVEPTNTLVSLNLDSHNETGTELASGSNFYASPRLSPNGRKLAWLSWKSSQHALGRHRTMASRFR